MQPVGIAARGLVPPSQLVIDGAEQRSGTASEIGDVQGHYFFNGRPVVHLQSFNGEASEQFGRLRKRIMSGGLFAVV